MRIELAHTFCWPIQGGQDRKMHALAQELVKRGIRVTVVAPENGFAGPRVTIPANLDIRLHPTFFTRAPLSLLDPHFYVKRLVRFYRHSNTAAPDAVLAFSYMYALAAKQAWPNTPVAYMAGAAAWDAHTSLHADRSRLRRTVLVIRRLVAHFTERSALRHVTRTFVESLWLLERFWSLHGPLENLSLVPGPIDTNLFCPSEETRRVTRTKLRIPSNAFLILGVGRLDANKNYAVLLKAVASLPGDWLLAIAGGGPEEPKLKALATSLGIERKVLFLGYQPNIEQLYAAADLFAHPSLLESCGYTVLEAMACALPCVVSSSVPLDLSHGINAMIASPKNPKQWAAAIQNLMSNPSLARNLGSEARKYCQQRPTWGQVCSRILDELALTTPKNPLKGARPCL